MNTPRCLHNSSHALYRVFVRPAVIPQHASLSQRAAILSLKPMQARYAGGKRVGKPQPVSATEEVERSERGYDVRFTTVKDIERSGRSRPPRDHEITDPQIMVLEDNNLRGPMNIKHVLSLVHEGESLRMIKPYVPATKETPASYAICTIVDKKDEFEREKAAKAKKAATKEKAALSKELEVNWGIGQHDLETKLKALRRFMAQPAKIQIAFGKKKRSKVKVERADAEAVVKRVREEVSELRGREFKPAEGEVGSTLRLFIAAANTP